MMFSFSAFVALAACMRGLISSRAPPAMPAVSVPSSRSLSRGLLALAVSLLAPPLVVLMHQGDGVGLHASQGVHVMHAEASHTIPQPFLPHARSPLAPCVLSGCLRAQWAPSGGTPLEANLSSCVLSLLAYTPSYTPSYPSHSLLLHLPDMGFDSFTSDELLVMSPSGSTLLEGNLSSCVLSPLAHTLSYTPSYSSHSLLLHPPDTGFDSFVTSDEPLVLSPTIAEFPLIQSFGRLSPNRSWTRTSTTSNLTCYKNHYMIDWAMLVDYEYVWARWFPAVLTPIPVSRYGPKCSRSLGAILASFAIPFISVYHTIHSTFKMSYRMDMSDRLFTAFVAFIIITVNTLCLLHSSWQEHDVVSTSFTLTFAFISMQLVLSILFGVDHTIHFPLFLFGGAPRMFDGAPIGLPRFAFWLFILSRLPLGESVCIHCAGNDPNCTGDASTCVLALALVANTAVVAGTAGAAMAISMGEEGKHILPLSWLQILKPAVLNTLQSLARRTPTGTPLDIPSLTIKELSAAISSGRISVEDGRFEFIRRMSEDGVDAASLNKMEKICAALPSRSDGGRVSTPLSRLQNSGALAFVFALSSQIVHRLSNASKASLSLTDSSASSLSASTVSMEVKRPHSSEVFSHMLVVWQSILGATGLANSVVLGPFLVDVVYDVISLKGWKVAFEHFLLYIQKIDSGCGWQLATATSLGSHDTFLHKAMRAAGVTDDFTKTPLLQPPTPLGKTTPGQTPPGQTPGLQQQISWNGKFNTEASARPCAAHNLGQQHNRLNKDGSCPFNHICDQFVSDKGPGGQCRGSHSRSSCDNPAKTPSKVN